MESLRAQRETGSLLNLAKTKQLNVQRRTSVQLESCPSTKSVTQPLSEKKNILIFRSEQNSEKSPGTLTSDPFY